MAHERRIRRSPTVAGPVPSIDPPTDVRRSYVVGSVDDPAERQADELAATVVAALESSGPAGWSADVSGVAPGRIARARAVAPVTSETPTPRIRRSAAIGRSGGSLDETAAGHLDRNGAGSSLPTRVRRSMEQAFEAGDGGATDFSGVRVHTGDAATRFNESIGAEAATVGSDVYFRNGLPDVSSAGGAHLLAHELAHVQQQSSGRVHRQTIRRRIGFELEDGGKEVRLLKRLMTPQERARHYAGNGAIGTPGGFYDPAVAIAPPKGLPLVKGPNFELQADETTMSLGPPLGDVPVADLEFVTDPLDENNAASIDAAARGIELVTRTIDGFRRGHSNWILPEDAYGSGYLFRVAGPWEFKPQFTVEIASANLPEVMEDLGKPANEGAADTTRRTPGRLRMHGAQGGGALAAVPRAPGAGMKVMGTSPQLARWAVAQLDGRIGGGTFAAGASGELIGMLSIMVQYVKMASMTIPSYAKVIAPLMSRHSIAKLFSTLPPAQRVALAANNAAELETTLLDAVNHLLNIHMADTVYAAGDPVFRAFTPEVDDLANPGAKTRIPVLNDVTIRDWVRHIPQGRDLLRSKDYARWVDQANALTMQPRSQAQQQGIAHLESLGSKGRAARRRDAAGAKAGAFEFRGAANDRVRPTDLRAYMNAVADYARDLANNGNATMA